MQWNGREPNENKRSSGLTRHLIVCFKWFIHLPSSMELLTELDLRPSSRLRMSDGSNTMALVRMRDVREEMKKYTLLIVSYVDEILHLRKNDWMCWVHTFSRLLTHSYRYTQKYSIMFWSVHDCWRWFQFQLLHLHSVVTSHGVTHQYFVTPHSSQ